MHIKNIFFGGKTVSSGEALAHELYAGAVLAALAVANGVLALHLAASSYAALPADALYATYGAHPPLIALNVLPALAFMALGWFLTRRSWAAYLISAVPTLGCALVNYYKIQLRGDPFLASDFRLIRTAGGIMGKYHLEFNSDVKIALLSAAVLFLLSILLLPGALRPGRARLAGLMLCLTALPLLYFGVYRDDALYEKTENNDLTNPWSDVELFISRGFWYPFIRSVDDAFPKPPPGYSVKTAEETVEAHDEVVDISPETKVNVVGVMLEAFSDLSDFPMLAELPGVQETYAPLHELESRCVSGDLLTNIFAGGTVDSEWGFLTGYSQHDEFRNDLDSYVRYFKSQGYDTVYRHPGYGWFYNRRNINRYLGFDESVFTEDGFGDLVSPETALYRSDEILFNYLFNEISERTEEDAPLFSFSVTYQNHGPYGSDLFDEAAIPAGTSGWSDESCGILSHYLYGVGDTAREMVAFTDALETLDQPVVLVFFGDHKPWLGNDNSVYLELGVNIDLETLDGFYNFYSTPYLIWANSAAKAVLGNDFTGRGEDISPCFLMSELFDRCGWDGPAFMALQRDVRAVTPLVHEKGIYLENGVLTDTLSPEAYELYMGYRFAEYRREHLAVE